MHSFGRGFFFASLLVLGAGAVSAEDARLVGHRAVYSLSSGGPSKSVEAAEGRYVFDLENFCDGYTLNERLVVQTVQFGSAMLTDYRLSAYESADGALYRFSSDTSHNGMAGSASAGTLTKKEEGSEVDFKVAEDVSFDRFVLPPLAHLRSVVQTGLNGGDRHEAQVFDGDIEKPVFLAISRLKPADLEPPKAEGAEALLGLRHWHLDAVYYDAANQSADSVPEFSFTGTLYENAVTVGLLLDYGDFSLKASLEDLEVYEESCE